MKRIALLLLVAFCLFASACGYHVAGHDSTLPKTIHVIAVPALENKTTSYRIEQKLTAATIHEFLAKTNYRIVSNPASADAVLTGKVISVEAAPLTFQVQQPTSTTASTAQATTMLVTVKCEVTLTESDSEKVLFHSDNFLFRNEYELSTDVKTFFEEQDPALDRLAKDFAQKLVAAVLENF
ncbi:MAG: hypothetical protein NVS9B14_11830 [Candidatus Acidiferrum sp.]